VSQTDECSDGSRPALPEVRHLNQEQLAHRLGVSQPTLEGWRYRGKGPAYLRLEGRIAYRLIDVERFEIACLETGARARSGQS
jgi:hypothetical protein